MKMKNSLTVRDIIAGVIGKNYKFLKISVKPDIKLFKVKLHQKYTTELFIAQKDHELEKLNKKSSQDFLH